MSIVCTSEDHRNIMPTAHMMAYFRSFSDIPYAKTASNAVGGEQAAHRVYGLDVAVLSAFSSVLAEARHKCFDRPIRGHSNVLEFAVGVAVDRGLSISNDPDKLYIGTDLPEMIQEARALSRMIDGRVRANHYLEAANVLAREELTLAMRHVGSSTGVLIIHEGLWTYLTPEQQVVCAENIRSILESHGGQWVTPDIVDKETLALINSSLDPEICLAMSRVTERIAALVGRDVERNYFATRRDAIGFFRNLGFEVGQYPLIENVESLASMKLWGEAETRSFVPALKTIPVYVMSLRK